jgi:hypothetical protein
MLRIKLKAKKLSDQYVYRGNYKMKKIKEILLYGLIVLIISMSYLYYKSKDYQIISKEIMLEETIINIEIKYKTKVVTALSPPRSIKFPMEFDIDINGVNIHRNTEIHSEADNAELEDVGVIKDYENDDFITYNVFYLLNEDGKDNYKNLVNMVYLKKENEYQLYLSWDHTLVNILIDHGYEQYTSEYMKELEKSRLNLENVMDDIK